MTLEVKLRKLDALIASARASGDKPTIATAAIAKKRLLVRRPAEFDPSPFRPPPVLGWLRGDPPLMSAPIAVNSSGIAECGPPQPHPGFPAALHEIAAAQVTWRQAEAWLRLKRGLAKLAEEYPEIEATFERGQRDGLAQLASAIKGRTNRVGRSH